jgi:MFS family permease
MSQISAPFHLYLFYGILVGAGMSGSFVPLVSTVSKWFFKKRSLMTGIVASGTGVGALLGPTLASRLISIYGWRMAYAILGGILLLMIVFFSQALKKNPAQIGQFAYGEDQKDLGVANLKNEGFSLREAMCTSLFWVFFTTGFCYGYCVFSTMVHITPHGIELGISAIRAANLIATIGAMGILGKVFWGMMGDIIGNKKILIIGFVFVLIASGGLVQSSTAWILFMFAGVFGFGYGAITVSHSPIIAELFGLKSHGLIFGIFNISVMIGSATGPLMTGYIFDVTHSYRIAFLISAVVSLSGIVLSIFLQSRRGERLAFCRR